MLPHFAAGPIRRGWVVPFLRWEVSRVWVTRAFYRLRGLIRSVLYFLPRLRNWLCLHFTSINVNVCLMNPKSTGRLSLFRRENSISTSPEFTTRLSDFGIEINPRYLSNSRDLFVLWKGWKATGTLKGGHWGLIEIFPDVALLF
jgi:hypothetical protein